jgi:hypothetical protein
MRLSMLYISQNQHELFLVMHTSYYCDKTEKLKLLTVLWIELDGLLWNIHQQRDAVSFIKQGNDI